MPLIPLVGVIVKVTPLQVVPLIGIITACGFKVTVTENTEPKQTPDVGVTK